MVASIEARRLAKRSLAARGPGAAGAILGASIALAWLLGSLALALAGSLLHIPAASIPGWLGVVGSIAALPVAALLGALFAPRPLNGRRVVVPMSISATLGSAFAVSLAYGVVVAGAALVSSQDALLERIGRALAGFFFVVVISFPMGLLIFGLPGLAVSAVSAWLWARLMRRTFGVRRS